MSAIPELWGLVTVKEESHMEVKLREGGDEGLSPQPHAISQLLSLYALRAPGMRVGGSSALGSLLLPWPLLAGNLSSDT